AIGARRRRDAIGNDRGVRDIGGGQHEPDARHLTRALAVDADESRMRMRRAQHGGVQRPGDAAVFDGPTWPDHKALATEPAVGLADHRGVAVAAAWRSTK